MDDGIVTVSMSLAAAAVVATVFAIAAVQESRHPCCKFWEFFPELMGSVAFQSRDDPVRCNDWSGLKEQMHMVWHYLQCKNLAPKNPHLLLDKSSESRLYFSNEKFSSVFGAPDKVIIHEMN
jgi:hypothetical protein